MKLGDLIAEMLDAERHVQNAKKFGGKSLGKALDRRRQAHAALNDWAPTFEKITL